VMRIPVKARCFPVRTASRTLQSGSQAATKPTGLPQRITVTVPPSATVTVVVTVLPAGGAAAPPNGGSLPPTNGLPPTGGPSRWLVLAGLGCLLAGAGFISRSARRARSVALS
jgi:LPXTG-motif cell wall-anchored protein